MCSSPWRLLCAHAPSLAARRALEAELGADVLRADEVPHIGIGHSLGCKVCVRA